MIGSGVRRLRRRTVTVHLQGGPTLRGVLRDAFRDSVLISPAEHLDEGVELQGDVLVPLDRIDFWQVT